MSSYFQSDLHNFQTESLKNEFLKTKSYQNNLVLSPGIIVRSLQRHAVYEHNYRWNSIHGRCSNYWYLPSNLANLRQRHTHTHTHTHTSLYSCISEGMYCSSIVPPSSDCRWNKSKFDHSTSEVYSCVGLRGPLFSWAVFVFCSKLSPDIRLYTTHKHTHTHTHTHTQLYIIHTL